MKHVLPRLPRSGKAVFATLSARVGSIGDNRLGGWYSYRASKAALNQLVRTAAVELARRSPDALYIALHPGTVATALSTPFAAWLDVHTPATSARHLLAVVDQLTAEANGGRKPRREGLLLRDRLRERLGVPQNWTPAALHMHAAGASF